MRWHIFKSRCKFLKFVEVLYDRSDILIVSFVNFNESITNLEFHRAYLFTRVSNESVLWIYEYDVITFSL